MSPILAAHTPVNPESKKTQANISSRLGYDMFAALNELGGSRIAAMDRAGIDVQVVSLAQPGTQGFGPDIALPMAIEANDAIFEASKAFPGRFAGLAALPTADPQASVKELERAVRQLGFKGALINGHTEGSFLDDKKYWDIFECAESLEAPIYLHPRLPVPAVSKAYFSGYEYLGAAALGFSIDTAAHFLRILFSGVFDAFPRLKIILGHLGEGLPFWLERLNAHTVQFAAQRGLKRTPAEYIAQNMVVTCSGNFSNASFLCTLSTLGIDNILFAVDWPYEANETGTDFLKALPVGDADREKIAHGNAERLLRLGSVA